MVLLRDDAIPNVVYGVCGAVGEMTALCLGIGNEVIGTAGRATTTYMFISGTGRTTAGRDIISPATICTHIDAGGGGGGGGGVAGVAGGRVGNEVAR